MESKNSPKNPFEEKYLDYLELSINTDEINWDNILQALVNLGEIKNNDDFVIIEQFLNKIERLFPEVSKKNASDLSESEKVVKMVYDYTTSIVGVLKKGD